MWNSKERFLFTSGLNSMEEEEKTHKTHYQKKDPSAFMILFIWLKTLFWTVSRPPAGQSSVHGSNDECFKVVQFWFYWQQMKVKFCWRLYTKPVCFWVCSCVSWMNSLNSSYNKLCRNYLWSEDKPLSTGIMEVYHLNLFWQHPRGALLQKNRWSLVGERCSEEMLQDVSKCF